MSWRALGAGRLQLVEADPGTAASLEPQVDPLQGESLRSVAATAAVLPKVPLHVVNQSNYSSIKQPSRLLELFPGLRVTAQLEVDAVSLSRIIADFDNGDPGSCILVLDAPGQALELIESLADEQLERLAGIVVEVSAEPLYAEDASAVVIASRLGARGFSVRGSQVGIFPFQSVFFQREARYWSERLQLGERVGLGQELAVAVERLEDVRSTLLVREGELAALSESFAGAIADRAHQAQELVVLQEQLQHVETRLAHRVDQHEVAAESERQLKQAHDELGGQIQRFEEETKELHDQIASSRQEADDLRTQFDERETLLRQLVERRDNLIKAGEDMTVKLEAETKRADDLSKKLGECVSKLEHASRQSQERGARVIDLEREREQAQQYQGWLNREVVKAEAHVDLIKEILLRGETP
ncbi:Chromosome partition protein Smc [compost metagenome]